MKISSLKLHSIAIADPPLRSSYGLHAPFALRTIVELEDRLTASPASAKPMAATARWPAWKPCATASSAWIRSSSPAFGRT